MLHPQIKWEKRLVNDNGSVCKCTVDGTDFRIQESRPYGKTWRSHKYKKYGVRYEVAVAIQTGWIVWVNGPFKAGEWHDIEIFRSGLKSLLKDGERVEADKGYVGEPRFIDVPNDMVGESKEQKKAKALARSRHETCNKRFKQFNCLSQTFRHEVGLHADCFFAIATITQLAIENGYPLFQVEYTTREYPFNS